MKLIKSLFVLAFAAISFSSAFAQSKIVYAGISIPRGDFGDDDYSRNIILDNGKMGGAATGMTIGFKYLSPFSIPKSQWFISADIVYNGLKKDLKDDYEDSINPDFVKFPYYLNIPVLVGLNYSLTDINPNASLWIEGGLGANCRILSEGRYEDGDYDFSKAFDKAFLFAFQVGVGLTINQKYVIGLHINNFGKDKLRGVDTKYDTTSDFRTRKQLQTTALTLRIGYLF